MKHSTLLVLAVVLALPALAAKPVPGPQGKGVAAKKVASTKDTEDKKILDAYLKALGKKWGYTITLDSKGGNLLVQSSPTDKEKLTVDVAGIKTEDDIETKLIAKLTEAKKIAQRDNPDKVPVYYQSDGQTPLADADASAVDNAIKQAGGPVKRVVISPKKDNGALVASLDLQDNYAYRQVKLSSDQQSSDEYRSAKSAYFNYNEWLKKRAASAKGKVKDGGPGAGNETAIDQTETKIKSSVLGSIVGADPGADAASNPDAAAVRAAVASGHVEQFRDGSKNFVYTQPGAKAATVVPIGNTATGAPDADAAANQVRDQLLADPSGNGARAKAALEAAKGGPVAKVPEVAKPNLTADIRTSPTQADDGAAKVAKGAGCQTPGDVFRSDAERYKQHQKDAWSEKSGKNIADRKKAQDERDTSVGKINDECDSRSEEIKNDKANSEKGRAAKLSALAKECQQRIDNADIALSKRLEKYDVDAEAKDKKSFDDKNGDNLDSFYWQNIPPQVPLIQKSYLTPGAPGEAGAGQRDWLAQATGFGGSFKDKYTNAYFEKFWKGSAQADSVKGCRTKLGDSNPNQENVDSKCVRNDLAKWIHETYYQKDDGTPSGETGAQGPSEEELKKAREYIKKQLPKK